MKGGFIFTTLLAIGLLAVSGMAETPRLISYQGRLTDISGNPLPDGAKGLRFIIWNHLTATLPANELWNSGPVTVTTTDGLFSVELGQAPMSALDPAIFGDSILWLGITVGADPEISPRTRLISAPYSLSAQYADSARVTTDRYVNETGDTITGVLSWMLGADDVNARLMPSYAGGTYFIQMAHGEFKSFLVGDDYGTLEQYDSMGTNVVTLSASDSAGGELYLRETGGSNRVLLDAGYGGDTDGGSLVLKKGNNITAIILQAAAAGDAAVVLPTGAISSGEMKDEPGLSNSESASFFTLSSGSGTTYTVDSVSITIPAAGYVIVEVGGYLNLYHTNGTLTNVYVKSDRTAGISSLSPGVHVVRIPADWPSSGSYSVGWPIHSSRLYSETSSGAKKYYLNVHYASGVSASSNIGYHFIRATYYPTLYGTATLVSNAENGGPSVMMGDPSTTEMPSTAEVITVEEHNARVEAALAEQREALEERLRAIEDEMQQLRDERESDARFGQ